MCKGEAEESAVKVASARDGPRPMPASFGSRHTGGAGGLGITARRTPTLGGAGLVVIWMRVKLPSGTGAVTDTVFPPSPIKARRREAVPWTAFCMFLQRWRIFGFGLPPGPAFAAACPMRMGEASWEAIITSGLAAAVRGGG